MAGNNQFTAAQFIEAIQGTGRYARDGKHTGCMGIVSQVADRLGCSWHTAKKYCSRDTTPFVTVAEAFEAEAERALDFAETKMYGLIQDGDGAMIRYLLSTKGKNRGFTERREVTGADGGAVETKTHVTGIDAGMAEIMALFEAARKRASSDDPAPDNQS